MTRSATLVSVFGTCSGGCFHSNRRDHLMLPTIVLVHGAFAESSSWDAVIDRLRGAGHPVIAAANPLRGLATDAAAVDDVVRAVDGPVVLVAHSYGGAVISNVDPDAGQDRRARVRQRFRTGTWGELLRAGRQVSRQHARRDDAPAGAAKRRHDRPIHHRLIASTSCSARTSPPQEAARMAATQRPATQEALVQPSGEAAAVGRGAVLVPCSAKTTASSRPPCSTSWPTVPADNGRSRSRAHRTAPSSRNPMRPRNP